MTFTYLRGASFSAPCQRNGRNIAHDKIFNCVQSRRGKEGFGSCQFNLSATFFQRCCRSKAPGQGQQLHSNIHREKVIRPVAAASSSQSIEMTQPVTPGKSRIGFLGLGIMGTPMIRNLLKAGFEVTIWNRTFNEACKELQEEENISVASNPKEVVEKSDVTIAMLADPVACRAVVDCQDSIMDAMAPGKAYIDCSTVDMETSVYVMNKVHARGGRYLEAPVSGSKGPAEQGKLVFLCGGDKDVFDMCQSILDTLGKKAFFLGETGQGAKMKIVVNMIMGIMMTSLAEGLTLAEASGLAKSDVIDVLGEGAMACPMFGLKGPAMAENPPKHPTAFPLKHQSKDLRFAMELAEQVSLGEALHLCTATTNLYAQGEILGYGDDDFSAIQKTIANLKENRQST